MVLLPLGAFASDNVYAILYEDGTLIFQHGDTPEPGKGVTNTYEVDLTAGARKACVMLFDSQYRPLCGRFDANIS